MKGLVSKMTVFMATIAMSLLTHAATYYGLFVGVNEYSDADYLYGCDWDAMRMMDAYTRGGYCAAANAELLTNLSATKQAVREKFAALAGTATAGDTVLVIVELALLVPLGEEVHVIGEGLREVVQVLAGGLGVPATEREALDLGRIGFGRELAVLVLLCGRRRAMAVRAETHEVHVGHLDVGRRVGGVRRDLHDGG